MFSFCRSVVAKGGILKLTEDGCWGKFDENSFTPEELAEKGKKFLTTFISKNVKV